MGKRPHPAESLLNGQKLKAATDEASNKSFEEGKVLFLLRALKLDVTKTSRDMRAIESDLSGNTNLTFQAFERRYQSFPLCMRASRLSGVSLHLTGSSQFPALFKAFDKTPFCQAFQAECEEQRSKYKSFGLVFPRHGFKHGLIIYGTDTLETLPISNKESAFINVQPNTAPYPLLVVRSFQKTIEAIYNNGEGWTPSMG